MQWLKNITYLVSSITLTFVFSQCSSAQKLQKEPPLLFEQTYCESWVAGTREGGTGINLFIPFKEINNNIELDSVYFRGKVTKLILAENKLVYVGRFKNSDKNDYEVVMSLEPEAEYGNPVPELPKKIPFELGLNECVISYKEADKTKYYKITNIINKKPKNDTGVPLPVRQ